MVRNYNAKKALEFVLMPTLVLTSMSFSVMEDAINNNLSYRGLLIFLRVIILIEGKCL